MEQIIRRKEKIKSLGLRYVIDFSIIITRLWKDEKVLFRVSDLCFH